MTFHKTNTGEALGRCLCLHGSLDVLFLIWSLRFGVSFFLLGETTHIVQAYFHETTPAQHCLLISFSFQGLSCLLFPFKSFHLLSTHILSFLATFFLLSSNKVCVPHLNKFTSLSFLMLQLGFASNRLFSLEHGSREKRILMPNPQRKTFCILPSGSTTILYTQWAQTL